MLQSKVQVDMFLVIFVANADNLVSSLTPNERKLSADAFHFSNFLEYWIRKRVKVIQHSWHKLMNHYMRLVFDRIFFYVASSFSFLLLMFLNNGKNRWFYVIEKSKSYAIGNESFWRFYDERMKETQIMNTLL
jgi:hypothetical protein